MISILLATYNGESFLKAQLDSILNQSLLPDKIYIQDDASEDDTWGIIEEYKDKYPALIEAKRSKVNSGSAKYNFMDMMINIKDDYVMLCDQDDIWLPNKIEVSLNKMQSMEEKWGKDTPILIHTDLKVVDENLDTIHSSFKESMDADYTRTSLNAAVIQNIITGCSAMYNRALADMIKEVPKDFVMHDWWLMLVAAAFGKIDHLDTATILYRQHGENEIGAKDVKSLRYKINRMINYIGVKDAIEQTYGQAESFLNIYRNQLSEKDISLLDEYIKIPSKNKWNKWRTIIRLKTMKTGLTRKIANFIFI